MLNIFKKKRQKIIDDTLSVLTFRKSNRLDGSHWNINRKLESVTELVEFYIYNDSEGINDNQRRLILEIEKKYLELIDDLENYLNNEISKIDSTYSSISIHKDLDIMFINIPKNLTELNKWEINFVEKKGFSVYEIGLKNWKPVYLEISA